jgi:hypothetical protein
MKVKIKGGFGEGALGYLGRQVTWGAVTYNPAPCLAKRALPFCRALTELLELKLLELLQLLKLSPLSQSSYIALITFKYMGLLKN